jgi:hypothetical protein
VRQKGVLGQEGVLGQAVDDGQVEVVVLQPGGKMEWQEREQA